jgi:hypothetical protein
VAAVEGVHDRRAAYPFCRVAATKPKKPELNGETVEVLLDEVRRMLDDEDRRGESLNTRGAAVAGFLGIVIALAGTVEGATVTSGGEYHAVAAGCAGAALLALLVSVGLIGWGVLLPSGASAIAMADVKKFSTLAFVTRGPTDVRGYLLNGAIGVLTRDRERNNRKARWLRQGYLGMGGGLFLVSLAGIVLAIQAIVHA